MADDDRTPGDGENQAVNNNSASSQSDGFSSSRGGRETRSGDSRRREGGGDRRREGGYRGRSDRRGGPGGRGRFQPRRSVCNFCIDKVKEIDYKNTDLLNRFLDDYGKIRPARKTGTCAKHQRRLAVAIKRARHLALLPFSAARLPD